MIKVSFHSLSMIWTWEICENLDAHGNQSQAWDQKTAAFGLSAEQEDAGHLEPRPWWQQRGNPQVDRDVYVCSQGTY